jgi:hypothetical protein
MKILLIEDDAADARPIQEMLKAEPPGRFDDWLRMFVDVKTECTIICVHLCSDRRVWGVGGDSGRWLRPNTFGSVRLVFVRPCRDRHRESPASGRDWRGGMISAFHVPAGKGKILPAGRNETGKSVTTWLRKTT